jgi:hypothetical protein
LKIILGQRAFAPLGWKKIAYRSTTLDGEDLRPRASPTTSTLQRTAPPHTPGPGGVIASNAIVIDVEFVDVKD